MSDRIRHLEDALAILQSSTTREPHPLLRPDLMAIKSGLELHSASNAASGAADSQDGDSLDTNEKSIDHFGTLAVRDDGAARYYGWSAGTEVSIRGFMVFVIILKSLYSVELASCKYTSSCDYARFHPCLGREGDYYQERGRRITRTHSRTLKDIPYRRLAARCWRDDAKSDRRLSS
jgi:hypothetical protein